MGRRGEVKGVDVDYTGCEGVFFHPNVQRMNHRQQLALAHFVYPDAKHARLGHCIGTGYLAAMLGGYCGLGAKSINDLKIAGTLHDVGHPASCHVGENLTKILGLSHKKHTSGLVEGMRAEIASCADYDVVKGIVDGTHGLSALVGSIIGADKVDYVSRDPHYCALVNKVDARRLYSGARLVDGKLVFKDRAEEIKIFLKQYWTNHLDIYLHPEVEIPRTMFQQAMIHRMKTGWFVGEIYDMVDSELHEKLRDSHSPARPLIEALDTGARHHVYGAIRRTEKDPTTDNVVITRLAPDAFSYCEAHLLAADVADKAKIPPHGVVITVSEDVSRLSRNGKELYELTPSGPVDFFKRHSRFVNGLERKVDDHFALRVVLLHEFKDAKLPDLDYIARQAEVLASAGRQVNIERVLGKDYGKK